MTLKVPKAQQVRRSMSKTPKKKVSLPCEVHANIFISVHDLVSISILDIKD